MPKITLLTKDSYLAIIENSAGTKLFQKFYVKVDKRKIDAVKGGRFSCAFFVSFILHNFNLIKQAHITVDSTLDDMEKSGWKEIKRLRKGAVLEWEEKEFPDKSIHKHLGFYIGNNQAISNSTRHRKPVRHHMTFGPQSSKKYRKIIAMYWHPKFN
ncbi:hypothetical protein MYX06_01315 [Patescibacteria group bacterium AH-259-L05]|nr:hypothetical protein [Patescibacteria group bacterium AH-259-L05]